MKSGSRWLRLYTEIYRDPKVRKLSDRMFRFWVECLCLAAENQGFLPTDDEIAFHLRLREKEAAARKAELLRVGLIDDAQHGFRPHNWDGRQYDSDSAAERMRRYRQRKRDAKSSTPLRNGDGIEADTDTEQKQIQTFAVTQPLDEFAANLYARHPKKRDRVLLEGALLQALQKSKNPDALMAEIDRVHSAWCETDQWREKNGQFAPSLARWIEDQGWTNVPAHVRQMPPPKRWVEPTLPGEDKNGKSA